MGRLDDARALVDAADAALPQIEGLYQKSLTSQQVDQLMLVTIKNYLENLRSALDYVGREIFVRFCSQGKGNLGGFPVIRQQKDFAARVNGMLPGLLESRPDIYQRLEAYQPYAFPKNEWLDKFNVLCLENKHEQLSPQTRHEQEGTQLTDEQGRSISWNGDVQFLTGGTVQFGRGGKLVFGKDGFIVMSPDGARPLNRRIDPKTRMPVTTPGDRVEHVVWVDFRFGAIDESVLPFLRECVKNIRIIVGELAQSL